jgi:hypothetical protein
MRDFFPGKCDPYVWVTLLPDRKYRFKTKVKQNMHQPHWCETFCFEGEWNSKTFAHGCGYVLNLICCQCKVLLCKIWTMSQNMWSFIGTTLLRSLLADRWVEDQQEGEGIPYQNKHSCIRLNYQLQWQNQDSNGKWSVLLILPTLITFSFTSSNFCKTGDGLCVVFRNNEHNLRTKGP